MSKRHILIIILITLGLICAFWAGALVTGNYAIEQINLVAEDLNKESKIRHEVENQLYITSAKLQAEIEKSAKLNEHISIIKEDFDKAQATIFNLKSDEYKFIYIGDYKLTHYCTEKRKHICGTGTGLTATGTQVTAGRTVAVDPSIIPYGTELYIEGYGWRIAEDCGGAVDGKHIDIAVETHSHALSMGTTTGGVWVLVKNNY